MKLKLIFLIVNSYFPRLPNFVMPYFICTWLRSLAPNNTTCLRDNCLYLFLSMFVLLYLLIFEKSQWNEIELAFNTNTTEKFTLRNFYSSNKC